MNENLTFAQRKRRERIKNLFDFIKGNEFVCMGEIIKKFPLTSERTLRGYIRLFGDLQILQINNNMYKVIGNLPKEFDS